MLNKIYNQKSGFYSDSQAFQIEREASTTKMLFSKKEFDNKYGAKNNPSKLLTGTHLLLIAKGGKASKSTSDSCAFSGPSGSQGSDKGGRESNGGGNRGVISASGEAHEKAKEPSVVDKIKNEAAHWHPTEINFHAGTKDGVSIDVKATRDNRP